MSLKQTNTGIEFSIATANDREGIYRMRHKVYAEEIGQHAINSDEQLKDDLDDFNVYVVAKNARSIIAFISITPSNSPRFSIDKYISRAIVPLDFDADVYEIRLLTVDLKWRRSSLALLLMYAAMRWIEAKQGKYIVAICRGDIIEMYKKAGIKPVGHSIKSGEVIYELCIASIEDIKDFEKEKVQLFTSLKNKITWNLPFPYYAITCFHGGEFFKAIGENLQTLSNCNLVINADVLDAWFPPSPKVIEAMQKHLPWLLQTSPPTHADGLIDAISVARNIDRNCILPGAGSSNLIFLALQFFLKPASKVLILDPCYGEYVYVLENVIRCDVSRFKLNREDGFVVDTQALLKEVSSGYDMIIIVNPNSPTGKYIPKEEMEELLCHCRHSLVWIDETYIEYTGFDNSLEKFAVTSTNVIVCKSMSKVYALSGVRAAYLCCAAVHVEALKHITPPWSISLPAQLAAINALNDLEYYAARYNNTHRLREQLASQLFDIGFTEIIQGVANFILFFLPLDFINAQQFVAKCKVHHLYVRDVKAMGKTLGDKAVRIAVKDEITNKRMIEIIRQVLEESGFYQRSKGIPFNNTTRKKSTYETL